MNTNKLHTFLPVVMLIILGLAGSILFFPVKMNSGKTCIFQGLCGIECCPCPHQQECERQQHLLSQYLKPYAFIWWLHLGLLILGIYKLVKVKSEMNKE